MTKKALPVLLFLFLTLVCVPQLSFAREGTSTDSASSPSKRFSPKDKIKVRPIEQENQKIDRKKQVFREKVSAEIEKKKSEFKDQLTKIKDERKRNIVARVNEKMSRINKNRTEHWKKVLVNLTEHLNKIRSRRDEVKNSGKNTSTVDSAINTAQGKIDSATAAVETQAAKEYVMTLGTETELKNTVGTAIKGEQSDLKTVQDSVDQARKSVRDALVSLMKLKGEKPPEPDSQVKTTTNLTQ